MNVGASPLAGSHPTRSLNRPLAESVPVSALRVTVADAGSSNRTKKSAPAFYNPTMAPSGVDQTSAQQARDPGPSGPQWIMRLSSTAARIADGEIRLFTRSGVDWRHKYPATPRSRSSRSNLPISMESFAVYGVALLELTLRRQACAVARALGPAGAGRGTHLSQLGGGRPASPHLFVASHEDKPASEVRREKLA